MCVCLYIRTYVCTYSLVMHAARDVLAMLALSLSVYTFSPPCAHHSILKGEPNTRSLFYQPGKPGFFAIRHGSITPQRKSAYQCIGRWAHVLGTHTYVRLCVPLHVHTHTLSLLLLTVLTLFFIDLSLLFVHKLIALSLLHCELFPLKLCRHVTKYLMGRPVSDPVEVVRTDI